MLANNSRGTIFDNPNFDKEADATALRAAMKGAGTDEKALIEVLTTKSNKQRQELKLFYKTFFGRDLKDDIHSETSKHFRDVLKALLLKPAEYDAYCLQKAMEGAGTREHTLTEILASRTNEELTEMKTQFKRMYKADLEDQLKSETSSDYAKLLISLSTANRQPDSEGAANVRYDVEALFKAGEDKTGTDESKFIQILGTRNRPTLQAIFEQYERTHGTNFLDVITSETSGDFKSALLTIAKCAINASEYFAEALYKSMKGLGTTDTDLIRIVVSRSEIDMENIKHHFLTKYGKTLGEFIKDDTSGDYKHALLRLIGDE